MSISVIIADDHPIFRRGVREILEKTDEINVIAEAENGTEAYRFILKFRPDILLTDLEMPEINGLDLSRKIIAEKGQTKVIILTMHKEIAYFRDALQSGVHGYLLKDDAVTDLQDCVKSIHEGKKYFSPFFRDFESRLNQPEQNPMLQLIQENLTPTEKIILKLISSGKTSQEIANMLFISINTVDNHRSNMAKKLNLEGKNSLLKFSIQIKDML